MLREKKQILTILNNKNLYYSSISFSSEKVKNVTNKTQNQLFNYPRKNFNGIFERPTNSVITHLHVLGIIVIKNL